MFWLSVCKEEQASPVTYYKLQIYIFFCQANLQSCVTRPREFQCQRAATHLQYKSKLFLQPCLPVTGCH